MPIDFRKWFLTNQECLAFYASQFDRGIGSWFFVSFQIPLFLFRGIYSFSAEFFSGKEDAYIHSAVWKYQCFWGIFPIASVYFPLRHEAEVPFRAV